MDTLAFFLTWTTYGTWLHGDERGSAEDRENRSVRLSADPKRQAWSASRMAEQPYIMDQAARGVVENAVRRHAEVREWRILALNVRTNHVHVVVVAHGSRPEIVAGQFKAWATRDLRARGLIGDRGLIWTRKTGTRRLLDRDSLGRACEYVENFQ